jgi:hypothetical protein
VEGLLTQQQLACCLDLLLLLLLLLLLQRMSRLLSQQAPLDMLTQQQLACWLNLLLQAGQCQWLLTQPVQLQVAAAVAVVG